MEINTTFLDCHKCGAEAAVKLVEKNSKKTREVKIGKCRDCKQQNTYMSLLRHNY